MSNQHMRVGREYFRLISHFEKGKRDDPRCRLTESGAALDAYLCPAEVPTIGAGSTRRLDGSPVQMGDTITEEEVFLLAERDAEHAADAVRKIKRPLKQHQFDALTVFTHNLGEGCLVKIAPLVEEGRWEDCAEKMYEYVRAWRTYEGKPYFAAMLGLRVRRLAEGLLLNGREWQDLCDPDDIGMPREKPPQWQPNGRTKTGVPGRYYDILLISGATQYVDLEAASRPLASLVETAKVSHDAPVASKIPPIVNTTSVGGSSEAAPVQATKPVAPQPSAAGPAPASVPAKVPPAKVGTKPPEPLAMPPSVQVSTTNDMGSTTRNMFRSKRFWGGALILAGRGIIVLDVGGHFAPAVRSFIGDGILMDWMTGIIVTTVGEMILDRGEKKAEGPMDTPKRIALMTPAP